MPGADEAEGDEPGATEVGGGVNPPAPPHTAAVFLSAAAENFLAKSQVVGTIAAASGGLDERFAAITGLAELPDAGLAEAPAAAHTPWGGDPPEGATA
jgi:hypothetical protein